ncbi:MAG: hypothetical protein ACD_44C00135G0003 [uncultured bacterium]|nr:MAG: hypothetical protein ACD_44C00135G0003 [uncultured bacterium]OGT16340.1 MAG: oxidative damage protection protein [Gammaproteobacteria bacterium RIFCSPHIGHO2_02_FULL_38_33]OGT24094.1 MAG: oxidative damage protection protein [Gammaproteobacteria bacterium RIFCSPHIGHO2_12_38_15]OGT67192.1 MAG: oxidative damage protection protein [Gammaproteobacteria bacterium RIFCSPLOWO2_02_FULL_38_11]OGT77922.1 MAG: oxidative damage protection protein [Gammaproteobacteria bacterium RIFCSPLOWO2_12_FULL_38_
MMRMIVCEKLKKEAEGLARPPFPGVLGEKIYLHISKEAWQLWQQRQTMIINEYRLNMLDSSAHVLLAKEMEKFFFENTA